ncbi:hypothetical protein Trydic_g7423 [Trypoxylus dichotomus]
MMQKENGKKTIQTQHQSNLQCSFFERSCWSKNPRVYKIPIYEHFRSNRQKLHQQENTEQTNMDSNLTDAGNFQLKRITEQHQQRRHTTVTKYLENILHTYADSDRRRSTDWNGYAPKDERPCIQDNRNKCYKWL